MENSQQENSQQVEVQILNAFVDHNQGGNPAGVVLHADVFTPSQKQKIAQQTGLSETAFVSRSSIADFKLDFFTPTRQIAHCGHATIATFSFLAQNGLIKSKNSSKETIDGIREIVIQEELAFMEQKAPQYQSITPHQKQILQSLALTEQDLLENASILKVNTGNSFIIIPVANPEILKNIVPDFKTIAEISEVYDLVGFYVFCPQTQVKERDAGTRMFAPRYGITEEAATGMAAGPLACYLYDILHWKKNQFLIQQGRFMAKPSPSLIIVDLIIAEDKITRLMVGGKGILAGKITINL